MSAGTKIRSKEGRAHHQIYLRRLRSQGLYSMLYAPSPPRPTLNNMLDITVTTNPQTNKTTIKTSTSPTTVRSDHRRGPPASGIPTNCQYQLAAHHHTSNGRYWLPELPCRVQMHPTLGDQQERPHPSHYENARCQ